ncbi:MAG: hypothetical protein ACP5N2_02995 [Candidatus Nanoarchaeia archaeon]
MNITKTTEHYVFDNLNIKESLKKDLINYSKLARKIISETDLKKNDFDAVVVALRRLKSKLTKKQGFEKDIKLLLSGTKLEIKTKMMVCILDGNNYMYGLSDLQKKVAKNNGVLHIVDGINVTTLILDQEYELEVNKLFRGNILKKNTNLIEIVLRTNENLENIPGYLAHLTGLLFVKGINLVEVLSCWTDTIFIISENDLQKTVDALNFCKKG